MTVYRVKDGSGQTVCRCYPLNRPRPVPNQDGCGCCLSWLRSSLFVNSNVVLVIVLIVLKCYGRLDWPWIWVLFPIWLWPTIGILFFVVFFALWIWANCSRRY